MAKGGFDGDGVLREERSWKRPLITDPADGKVKPYTRASSLADYVSNTRGIQTWRERYLARGMGMREDLAALAAVETYTTGWADADEDSAANQASGRELDSIIVRALDTARIHEKADMGTAGHKASNPGYTGHVPSRVRDGVATYQGLDRIAERVATEVFTVNHELHSAGTFDHLRDGDDLDEEVFNKTGIHTAGTLVVEDKKFGQWKERAFEIQVASYAGGLVHGRHAEWGKTWTFEEKFGKPVNTKVGLIAHIPFEGSDAWLIPIDLEQGYAGALLARRVHDWQRGGSRKAAPLDTTDMLRARAKHLIVSATTSAEMNAIAAEFADVWTPSMTALGKQRLALTTKA